MVSGAQLCQRPVALLVGVVAAYALVLGCEAGLGVVLVGECVVDERVEGGEGGGEVGEERGGRGGGGGQQERGEEEGVVQGLLVLNTGGLLDAPLEVGRELLWIEGWP